MKFSDEMVTRYAKKILGFAYSKTRDTRLAEDLSQEILLSLSESLPRYDTISDMDGFVYTICCYTWSKYLRGNKRHWQNIDVDLLFELKTETDVEAETERREMLDKLRAEVAYLSKLHRQITVMFYFENKRGAEIAAELNIPHSTVRWHLGEIRTKLREGIEMGTLNLEPRSLGITHWGRTEDTYGLGKGSIADNVCLACYGKALTIEEIARTLSVAAGYIEGPLKQLAEQDYIRVVGKNKYITNFLITTPRDHVVLGLYKWNHISEYAERLLAATLARYERIRAIGFIGSELDRDFVLWSFIAYITQLIWYRSHMLMVKKLGIEFTIPKRKDGSETRIWGTIIDESYFDTQTEFSAEDVLKYRKSDGNGVKPGDKGFMLDSYYTIHNWKHWRDFEDEDIMELTAIANIIHTGAEPSELDRVVIAKHVENGYVSVEDGRPKLMIPVFSKAEFETFRAIADEIIAELGEDFFASFIETFDEWNSKTLPDFLPKDERDFHRCVVQPHYALLYWLNDAGKLRTPDKDECKRLCIMVWE